jgi:hypothetical protein
MAADRESNRMEPGPELDALRVASRAAYERARLRAALLGALPVLAVVGIAYAMDGSSRYLSVTGALLVASAVYMLHRGGDLGRSLRWGIGAGAVPFAAMHAAQHYGHVCNGSACFSVCLPAAFGGALVAGVGIGRYAARRPARFRAWLAAVGSACLTGSLACACVGVGGLAGLSLGLLVGSAPLLALTPRVSGG